MAAARRHRIRPVPTHLGEPTSIENVHLSLRGEAVALVAGIRTYDITALGRAHPFPRMVDHIKHGLPKYSYIHPGHRCGVSWNDVANLDDRRLFDDHSPEGEPPF
jgi:hypothetical protein